MLTNLRETLKALAASDAEQEVRGMALPVVDAALSSVRGMLAGNAILDTVRDVISPDSITDGEPVRAVDVLMVVDVLLGALPPQAPPRMPRASVWSPDFPRRSR